MTTTANRILAETNHRPFQLPPGKWIYYQEWNKALFLHWQVPLDILCTLVPVQLNIDTFEGKAYVSLVAFTMERIRPRHCPSLKFISDFNEINIRTYIENDGMKGVYFLNIEAQKWLSVFIANKLSGLPYEKADIRRTANSYRSKNSSKKFHLEAVYSIQDALQEKTLLDNRLTERYCLYLYKNDRIFRYDIHHKEWPVKNVVLQQLHLDYQLGPLKLTNTPDHIHYSDGVQVLAWKRLEI